MFIFLTTTNIEMEPASIKTIFFKYLLMPIIVAIMVFIMSLIRKAQPAIQVKHIIVYVLVSGLCLALPGFFGFSGNLFSPYWYLISQIIYLILGILHVNLLHQYFRKHIDKIWLAILFESVLTITCLVFGGFLFTLIFKSIGNGLGNPYMAATSIFTFTIPLVFYYCYVQFISIPFDIYKTWRYDPDQKPFNFEGIDFDKLMVLNVELSKNIDENKRFLIKAKTLPTEITFGDWFFRVVDDYNFKNPNTVIELLDSNKESYYWIFYVKKSFFSVRKYIDFEKDVSTNQISENQTIICKRVIRHQEEGKSYLKQ
ncbi:TssN family type VI secretion system protein [Chishuiella sp.]|uniref:TssN family type VI secretion system protein n=1 Tax=Chishuiella sp. TaxID=1969467 RepID=UPI0028AFC9FD|nr:TssN family type VI secretion system protein [Chishuiella sp.]